MKYLTRERFDAIKQSPRQASVTDVEDLCDEIEHLRDALKKFGRHPTGDMEGVGRCAGFGLARPFHDAECDCGLTAILSNTN